MPDVPALGISRTDVGAALARAVGGGIPFVGGLVTEVVNIVIPNQRLDRVVAFVEALAAQVGENQQRQELLAERLRSIPGSALLEEGLVQAARAITDERQRRIARIVCHGVTEAELRYDRTKKLLAIHDSLTDSEFILLNFYSRTPTIGSPWHREQTTLYPDVLRPVSRESGAPRAEVERGALRDSYERTLIANGLIEQTDMGLRITSLGKLLLEYSADSFVGG